MLTAQAKKQSSFYVCASCRRQNHPHLAQLRSCSRLWSHHFSTTSRPFASTTPTLSILSSSLDPRNGTTRPRHAAPPKTTRTHTRGFGGGKFPFGSPTVPGQSNNVWGSKNISTPGTPSPTTPAWAGQSGFPAATGTSAWGGATKTSTPATPTPAWGGAKMSPVPAFGRLGSGALGLETRAWTPSKPPPTPTGPETSTPEPQSASETRPAAPTSPAGLEGRVPLPPVLGLDAPAWAPRKPSPSPSSTGLGASTLGPQSGSETRPLAPTSPAGIEGRVPLRPALGLEAPRKPSPSPSSTGLGASTLGPQSVSETRPAAPTSPAGLEGRVPLRPALGLEAPRKPSPSPSLSSTGLGASTLGPQSGSETRPFAPTPPAGLEDRFPRPAPGSKAPAQHAQHAQQPSLQQPPTGLSAVSQTPGKNIEQDSKKYTASSGFAPPTDRGALPYLRNSQSVGSSAKQVPQSEQSSPTRATTSNVQPGAPQPSTAPLPLWSARRQPSLERGSGDVSSTPPPAVSSNKTPPRSSSGSVRSAASGELHPATLSGAARPSVNPGLPSSGSKSPSSFSGATTFGASVGDPGKPKPAVGGAGAGGPSFGAPPGAVASKPVLGASSAWVPGKAAFAVGQAWTPGKMTISTPETLAKQASTPGKTTTSTLEPLVKQAWTLGKTTTNTLEANPKGPSATQFAGQNQNQSSSYLDTVSRKPPVRLPPPGAEYPQLPRRESKKTTFENTSPWNLPARLPARQGLPEFKPSAPVSENATTNEPPSRGPYQQNRRNEYSIRRDQYSDSDRQDRRSQHFLPGRDRYPDLTASSRPQDFNRRRTNDTFEDASRNAAVTASSRPQDSDTRQTNVSFEETFRNAAVDAGPTLTAASDDWGDEPPRTWPPETTLPSTDQNGDSLEERQKAKDDSDWRSRGSLDYRSRGRVLEKTDDPYAARDQANRRKKFGGVRKQYEDEEEVDEFDDFDEYERGKAREKDKARRKQDRKRREEQRAAEEAEAAAAVQKNILLPEYITVYDLAHALRVKPAIFLRDLEQLGFENTLADSVMTGETAALVAAEYGFEPTVESGVDVDLRPRPPPEDLSSVPPRPPIVTIMGHVDHGKTTILDTLRKSSIVSQEFGGITQHIGAFSVKLSKGKTITFLDTPGHAAFLSMRQRGANVTDIVILVVAVDDSVKPQTIEAIKHAQNAKVPMIVAINKIDLDDTTQRLDLVKQDLANHEVEIEDYGGDVQTVAISGRTGRGLVDLEDAVLTLSEVLDMRAETDGMVEAWVLEASIKTDGRAATILVKRGTLRIGDLIVAGAAYTRVRIMRNEAGVDIEEAGPGTPVEIYGSWKGEPLAGDLVLQAPDETKAQAAVDYRQEIAERAIAAAQNAEREALERERAEALYLKEQREAAAEEEEEAEPVEVGPKVVSIIVKGDVMGSVEAVSMAIQEVGNNEVRTRILRSSPGQVTESDVDHMATAKGAIVNFNNTIPGHIRQRANLAGVVILDHNIIYETVQAVKDLLSKELTPTYTQRVLAEALVQQVFPINITKRKFKNIAGSKVTNGKITRGGLYRVMRDGEEIHKGKLSTLKQKQTEVKEVPNTIECGIMFEEFDQFQEGDRIQLYEDVENKRYL